MQNNIPHTQAIKVAKKKKEEEGEKKKETFSISLFI